MKSAVGFAGAMVAAGCLAGCNVSSEPAGPLQHLTQQVELGKVEMVRVEFKMGAGELKVDSGSSKLAEADFAYNVPSWKPVLTYDASSFRGQLLIEQPNGLKPLSNVKNTWEVRLNDTVPMDVIAHLGAGEAQMDLGKLTLRSVEVHMGVGELRLDLRGSPKRDYNVEVHGGVGEATIYLPPNVGVDAKASGGIGNINAIGLEKQDDRWIRTGQEHAPATIHMEVHGGIGNIKMIAE